MSDEFKVAIYTAVEISVFSLLVLIIVFFGGYAKDALNIKNNQDASVRDITEYRELYEIDKGKRIDVTTKGLSNTNYLNIRRVGYYSTKRTNFRNWVVNETTSNVVKGEDILNYISKKGGKYDILLYFNGKNKDIFKRSTTFTLNDLFEKYGLGRNTSSNNIYIYPTGTSTNTADVVYIRAAGQNENMVFFLREQMGTYVTSEFYCSSIFDSTDNTYLAVVFKLK